jgi:hypothetical protein
MGKLTMKDPTLNESYFVANFIYGLKEYIKVHLSSHNPKTLVQAYSLSRNYESSGQRKSLTDSGRWTNKSFQTKFQQPQLRKETTDEKPIVPTRWENVKCFKCQEPWIPGHNKVCKFRN